MRVDHHGAIAAKCQIARAAFPGSMRVLSSKRAGLKIMSKALHDPKVHEYRRLASEYEKRADLVDIEFRPLAR